MLLGADQVGLGEVRRELGVDVVGHGEPEDVQDVAGRVDLDPPEAGAVDPAGEQHFMKIVNEVTYLKPHTDETSILPLDSPDLFKYPIAYLCEPGSWEMSEAEAAGLRAYLHKGGFLIVDDFRYQHWGNFEAQMLRVLPGARFYDLDLANPIFHAFFEVKTLDVPQYYDPPPAIFRAVYEDNDPAKRIVVMINYNTDISEFWEWSDTGLKPIDESNEAYKLGVNYIVYGLTH